MMIRIAAAALLLMIVALNPASADLLLIASCADDTSPVTVYRFDAENAGLTALVSVDVTTLISHVEISTDDRWLAVWRSLGRRIEEPVAASEAAGSEGKPLTFEIERDFCVVDLADPREYRAISPGDISALGGRFLWDPEQGWQILTFGHPHKGVDVEPRITELPGFETEAISHEEVPADVLTERGMFIGWGDSVQRGAPWQAFYFRIEETTGRFVSYIGPEDNILSESYTDITIEGVPSEALEGCNTNRGRLRWADEEFMTFEFPVEEATEPWHTPRLRYERATGAWSVFSLPSGMWPRSEYPWIEDATMNYESLLQGYLVIQETHRVPAPERSSGRRTDATGRYELRTRDYELLASWDLDPRSTPLAVADGHFYFRTGDKLYRVSYEAEDTEPELLLEDYRLHEVFWAAIPPTSDETRE